jgi:ABC-2 type transport system ATP-binding protein
MIQRNAIEIDDLVKRFGDVTAVDGLSLEIREGEIFGLLGPTGRESQLLLTFYRGSLSPQAAPPSSAATI